MHGKVKYHGKQFCCSRSRVHCSLLRHAPWHSYTCAEITIACAKITISICIRIHFYVCIINYYIINFFWKLKVSFTHSVCFYFSSFSTLDRYNLFLTLLSNQKILFLFNLYFFFLRKNAKFYFCKKNNFIFIFSKITRCKNKRQSTLFVDWFSFTVLFKFNNVVECRTFLSVAVGNPKCSYVKSKS